MTAGRSLALVAAATLAVGLIAVLVPARAAAQPTVIADARLDGLRGNASVGVGYGMATNTIYGSCLANARNAGDTSFDLDFQLLGLHSSEDIDGLDREGEKFVRTHLDSLAGDGRPLQALVAIMAVQARVRPLDESDQKLVDSVLDLLEHGRLSTFVSVCGTHYVRSIKRRSSLYVLFTYEAATADKGFENGFRSALSGFELASAPSKDGLAQASAINAAAAQHNLRIVEWAIGLDAQPGGGIAFDMASYRKIVDQAFQAAQHDRAGVPYEMEVVPWLSHPGIVTKLLPAAERADVDLYTLRQIVGESAEYYLELAAHVAEARAQAVAAERCQDHLYRTYVRDGHVVPAYATAYVKSERLGGTRLLPLTALIAAMTPAAIATVKAQADSYALDLDAAGQPRAPVARCLAQLERAELKVRHQTIAECTAPATPFTGDALATLAIADAYCFPELAPALPHTRAGG
jgi:hypothetical protein